MEIHVVNAIEIDRKPLASCPSESLLRRLKGLSGLDGTRNGERPAFLVELDKDTLAELRTAAANDRDDEAAEAADVMLLLLRKRGMERMTFAVY